MAVFTPVTAAELKAWLNTYSLGELLELQGIASGIENTNYFVTTTTGRYVLTLFEKLSPSELPFYLNLMAHLAGSGIPCPSPMANLHNRLLGELNGKPACIVSRLSGKSLMQPQAADCAAVGEMLGKLHIAGQSFKLTMPNPRGSEWRAHTATQVLTFLSRQDAELLQSEVALHARHSLDALPQGTIHADLFRDNVLFEGSQVSGLIDFYFACTGNLLYDLAITVNDWCLGADARLEPSRTQALLRAYHDVRPLLGAERNSWPLTLRAAALRFWLSRLHDLYLPRDGELLNAHNPEQFKFILQQHIAANGDVAWV